LEIEGGDCRGVIAGVAGVQRRFVAAKEVVLAAGALHTPKILLLSGIGPADHLRAIGIPITVESPRVGLNLHDHLVVRLVFETKEKIPPRTDTGHAGITYHRTSTTLSGPDIQVSGRADPPGMTDLKPEYAFIIAPGLMKPKSRGTVRLTSADPLA